MMKKASKRLRKNRGQVTREHSELIPIQETEVSVYDELDAETEQNL